MVPEAKGGYMSDYTVEDVLGMYWEKKATLALMGLLNHQSVLDDLVAEIGNALVDQSGQPHSPKTIFGFITHDVLLEGRARDLFLIMAAWYPSEPSR